MAAITPDFLAPQTDHPGSESSESPALFNDLDADLVLHSRDSHTFRVVKLYLIKCSTVIGGLIQSASDSSGTTDSASATSQTQLPEVWLSESGATLSSLVTFIFPVTPVLPSTLEETMELLSVAQKYEMNTVLSHIRGALSRQHPPFISPENAFIAYSLAQRNGLRDEAIQAARLTLKLNLTIEDLGDKLAIMSGSYLEELWKYHQRVQTQLRLYLRFGTLAALNGLTCSKNKNIGTPYWITSYILSIIERPSLFDPFDFQQALVQHTRDPPYSIPCTSCVCIPATAMRTFWTTVTTIVHGCMERAELGLSIPGAQTNMRSPAPHLPLPENLDLSEADLIVRTSELTHFRIHKSILASASCVFRDMFTLPTPPNHERIDGLPVVDISEDTELVRALITVLYPIPSEIPASYDKILELLAAAQKYDMKAVQSVVRAEIACRPSPALNGAQAFRAYAIASNSKLTTEMELAARLTLDQPMTFEHLGKDLRLFEGGALRELASFRKGCRDRLLSCLESFLDIDNGPSKIWVDCSKPIVTVTGGFGGGAVGGGGFPSFAGGGFGGNQVQKTPPTPTLPLWVRNLFSPQIEELKQSFTRPLVKPSSIREKYLQALREHAAPDICTPCLGVHALKGEGYCLQLESALAEALGKTPAVFT